MPQDFAIVDLEDIEEDVFPESGILHRKLTDALGSAQIRVNAVTLRPGQRTAPHVHERQEEIYVALDGGWVELDGSVQAVGPRAVIRIGPDPVRSIRNETDAAPQTWLMFGTASHGTVEDFGEYRLPDE